MREHDNDTPALRAEKGEPEIPTTPPAPELALGSMVRGPVGSEAAPESDRASDGAAADEAAARLREEEAR